MIQPITSLRSTAASGASAKLRPWKSATQRVEELSGGQRQAVAVARAIATACR